MKNTTLSGKIPKRNILIEIISALLLIFFVHTLISSYIQLQSLKNLLAFYTENTTVIAWTILITEIITVALIFFPRTRLIGFIAAFLMTTFAGIIILRYPHYPHDFGGIFNSMSRNQKWVLIISVALLSVAGTLLILYKSKYSQSTRNGDQVVFT
jgi:uncharacterized membrane protein